MGMKVKDLMQTKLHTCHPDDSLAAAARIMWERDCGIVPVVDGAGRLVGVVTDRDACMASYTKGLPLQQIPVASAMASRVVSLHVGDDLTRAHEEMRTHKLRRLPVVAGEHRLVGLISLKDLATAAAKDKAPAPRQEVARTLAAVSAERVAVAM
jgi:CBS domain-containing protein